MLNDTYKPLTDSQVAELAEGSAVPEVRALAEEVRSLRRRLEWLSNIGPMQSGMHCTICGWVKDNRNGDYYATLGEAIDAALEAPVA